MSLSHRFSNDPPVFVTSGLKQIEVFSAALLPPGAGLVLCRCWSGPGCSVCLPCAQAPPRGENGWICLPLGVFTPLIKLDLFRGVSKNQGGILVCLNQAVVGSCLASRV